MSDNFPKCRGCDTEIRWARVDGRWTPFEVEPSKTDGTHVLVRDDVVHTEYVALWVNPDNPRDPRRAGLRYQKHWDTCPARRSGAR